MNNYLVMISTGYVESQSMANVNFLLSSEELLTGEQVRDKFVKDVTECLKNQMESSFKRKCDKTYLSDCCKQNQNSKFCSECGKTITPKKIEISKEDIVNEIFYLKKSSIDDCGNSFWFKEFVQKGWSLFNVIMLSQHNDKLNKIIQITGIDYYIKDEYKTESSVDVLKL